MRVCMVSIDIEEDLGYDQTFNGVENLDRILKLIEEFKIRATLFTTGNILEIYPDLVEKWAKKHEIGCHGYYHVALHELTITERKKQLEDFCQQHHSIVGEYPKGFRAVQHTIDSLQLKLLEKYGFSYDSSIVPRYVLIRKYIGYKGKAPTKLYHPSYYDCRERGNMGILEIPNSPLIGGIPLCGTWIRIFGPRFYRFLMELKEPQYLSLTMHSWDATEYNKGPFSRNSGEVFVRYLNDILKLLRKNYKFRSGDQIMEEFR